MSTDNDSAAPLEELVLESSLRALKTTNKERQVPIIDLSDFSQRRDEITEQLWQAASEYGFFQLKNHGIAETVIEDAFATSQCFFDLPEDVKGKLPLKGGSNAGWESMAQVRPSTGTADQKESFQITSPRMKGLWPENELAGFQNTMLGFESQCWNIGMKVLSCFADKLGFERHFFSMAHNPASDDYQSTLRLLHYYAIDQQRNIDENCWRAGAHSDFDCLTLLFQHSGQDGLEVCPGKEATSNAWTPVIPQTDIITCNIGDMLMRWSDDKLKSTLHRVKMPGKNDYRGSRYSIAFFCQANKDIIIQGPEKKYEPISAEDYLNMRIQANFSGKRY